jgi:hypothetical protein
VNGNTFTAGTGTLTFTGSSTLTVPDTGTAALRDKSNTFDSAQIISLSPAINTSGLKLNGAWSTAGDPTTDKPQVLIEPSGASSINWSTYGTGLGINAASGFTGNLIDAKTNGVSKFWVDGNGLGYLSGTTGAAFRISGFAGGAISIGYGTAAGYFNTHDSGIRIDSGSQPFYVWDGGSGNKSIMLDPVNHRIGFGSTISTTNTFIERTADARIGLGKALASGWVTQYFGASGAIVGTTTNGSPSNDLWITNSVSTGTGASTGAINFGTYGSNGVSGAAIGALTKKASITSAGFIIGDGGTAIAKVISAPATLDFDLTAVTQEDLPISVVGAASGDPVFLAVPPGSVTATSSFTAWVSAVDTVTVRCKTSATGENPASGVFRATVIKH